ncbi:MAG: anti-sigma factor family protein, partial [Planctomycetota bacterium]
MQCGEVRELLSPMTDREVTPEEFSQIEEHLNSCRECAFTSTMIVGLKRLVGSWEGVPASEAFREKVIEQVKREPSPAGRPVWRLALYGGAAALGVLAPGLLVVFSLMGGDEKGSSRAAREGAGAEAPPVRDAPPRAKAAAPPAAGAAA